MTGRRNVSKQRRFFALTACVMLILSTLLIGISIQIQNVSAGAVDHKVGNLDVLTLTDYGRILIPLNWGGIQTVQDDSTLGFIGLVIDHDNYDHTPGAEDIADSYGSSPPYMSRDDFEWVNPISMIIDNGITQKSFGSFQNKGLGTGYPDDILINQSCWTVLNKDWAILQWTVSNVKSPASDLTNVHIGLEVPISKEGGRYGLGGELDDGGDDVDGYDGTNEIYWAKDTSDGTTIGFASAIVSDPITHYYAEDYHADYSTEYVDFFGNDTWLYQRLQAPSANATDGVTPGNITATVGWDGFDILAGESRTVTLVIAINGTYNDMITAIKDAQYYYNNIATGFQITEIRDSGSASARIEVFNNGREPTDPSVLTFTSNLGPLTGTWSVPQIQTYGYGYLDVLVGTIDAEGDTITLREGGVPIDQVSFGQDGIAPDPLDTESTGRRFDTSTASYTDEWLRDPNPTWGSENDVGTIITTPSVVINRVLFNPFGGDEVEGYVELMYIGNPFVTINISDYMIVCDDWFQIPVVTTLNGANKFYVFRQADMPSFFAPPTGNMDPSGDNVYLYDKNGNLLDMVGWSSAHNPGRFMSRMPDGNGTHQGYDDATSQAAGWIFDQMPSLMITEFYADATNTDVEVYNPRGGDKVFGTRWTIQTSTGGTITPSWTNGFAFADGGYDDCTSPGPAGVEGDTISLYFNPGSGDILIDEVSYGTYGVAPDPLSGESTARWWDSTIPGYSNDWNRDPTDTFGVQNDVPPINSTSWVIMNEVMFNPVVDPYGKYVVLINIMPFSQVDISNYWLVCDDAYQLPNYPVVPGGFDGILYYGWSLIIRYNDSTPTSDAFFDSIDATPGDNIYFYDSNGRLLDMVGWNNAWSQGMSVRRVPDGFGTYQGYDDATSTAAGWVFNSPLQVFVTEISDSSTSDIEVYNPWYPSIDFGALGSGYEFENSGGQTLTGSWPIGSAGSGQYAHFQRSGGGSLNTQGDTLSFKHNNILIDEVSYGQKGTVPDPLLGESVQRYWNGAYYTDVWERNWTTGPNFGVENNVPPANFSSGLILNEIMFNPNNPQDAFVELFCRFGLINISGYKIVGNNEFIIPDGTVVDSFDPFYYLLYTLSTEAANFFNALIPSGDNIYLYDRNGSLIDMAGWSSAHTQGKSMVRLPDGNGTRDGFDDTSSIAAGWVFDIAPTIQFVKLSTRRPTTPTGYGSLGEVLIFNLTIENKQSVDDTVILSNSTINGYPVVMLDENGTYIITEVFVPAGEEVNITVTVILPSIIPFIPEDNITITVQSQNISLFKDILELRALVVPFINPTKYVYPQDIYISGTGHDEITTITLNLTGMGAVIELMQPQDVIFCVDISGSMDPAAIPLIKEGLTYYVQEMKIPDQGAVVTYGGPPVLLNPLTDNYSALLMDIDSIPEPPMGPNTPIGDAINISVEELLLNGIKDHIHVIILLTDGQSNIGRDPITEAWNAASHNITIFTIGLEPFSGTLNQADLMAIAAITGGQYFYAPTAAELPEIYRIIAAYVGDIAGRDTVTTDSNPMIRDVLPPWIELVPGSFSIPPETDYINATGYRILEWNLSALGIGKSWEVTFQVKSTILGMVRANDLNSSRVYYEDYFDIPWYVLFPETKVNVLSGVPLPPKLKIDILPNKNDILLTWDERIDIVTEYYLIYNSPTPTGFDFSSPWIDTSANLDPLDPGGIAVGNRISWNHTGAALPGNSEYSEQWYYCIRSVNNMGEMSRTSRTVGKWTREFTQAGVYSFSLPLEPIETMAPTADFFVNDMAANYIKWMDPGTHDWMIHGGIYVNDTTLEVGRGYEVEFASPTKYTFLGMPGSHIMYKSDSFIGFDYNTEADSLDANVPNPVLGDVILTWDQPIDLNVVNYNVYRSTTRDGFDDGSAILLATLPRGTETYIDFGAAASEGKYYYIVVPLNITNAEGASTYSIGVWTEEYLAQYDTIGIPLVLDSFERADWYCDQINNVVGINYYMNSVVGWTWHSKIMPAGAFDPILVMTEGYQISTIGATRFIFIGR